MDNIFKLIVDAATLSGFSLFQNQKKSDSTILISVVVHKALYWIPVAFMMRRSVLLKVYKSKSNTNNCLFYCPNKTCNFCLFLS